MHKTIRMNASDLSTMQKTKPIETWNVDVISRYRGTNLRVCELHFALSRNLRTSSVLSIHGNEVYFQHSITKTIL